MEKKGNPSSLNQGTEHLLAALLPPSNISRQIDLIRERLFSDYCLVSAVALPPLVPLLFLPPGRYNLQERQLKEKIGKAFPITAGHYRVYQENLFLTVDSNGGYDCLKQELKNYLLAGVQEKTGMVQSRRCPYRAAGMVQSTDSAERAGTREAPFPCTEGFFLAAPEKLADFSRVIKKVIKNSGNPGLLHFSSYSLVVLKLESYSTTANWWQNIRWEETSKLNCRKPSKGAARP